MGIIEWLLVWLIVNALFVVWRALGVSAEMEIQDRSTRKMPDLKLRGGLPSISKAAGSRWRALTKALTSLEDWNSKRSALQIIPECVLLCPYIRPNRSLACTITAPCMAAFGD